MEKHKHRYVLEIVNEKPMFICECGADIKMKVTKVELVEYVRD